MALVLIVEDGSIVSGANSYATLAQIRAYNAQRGIEMPSDDDELIELATQAMDYLESYEPRFMGDRSSPLFQELSWPRTNAYLYGNAFPTNGIPSKLIVAQSYLAGIAETITLNPVIDTRAITKEVIGPIETDYDPKSGATLRPIIPAVDSILVPLLKSGTGMLRTLRV